MIKINKIIGRQIIDSRGNPTCEADVILNNGIIGRGAVPSGASTGKLEALELRDNEAENFLGKSVNKAVFNINNEISNSIGKNQTYNQESFDRHLIELDGTANKERLEIMRYLQPALFVFRKPVAQ